MWIVYSVAILRARLSTCLRTVESISECCINSGVLSNNGNVGYQI